MTSQTTRADDQGISESIGFMLIFGIVIAGIALVVLYGYPMLLEQQTSADEKIMEKNMIVLQNDIKSLAYKTVPFKETSLKIGGGSLAVHNSGSSTITISDVADTVSYLPAPYDVVGTPFDPGELRYESVSAETDISLQNGAVVMRPRIQSGSTTLAEPRWFFDINTNTMVINLIKITSAESMAKEGIGTVQMELVGEPSYNEEFVPPGMDVKIIYTPDTIQDYSLAWDDYIWNKWNIPQSYKTAGWRSPNPGTGIPMTYYLSNQGASPMKIVVKIFEVNIRSL